MSGIFASKFLSLTNAKGNGSGFFYEKKLKAWLSF